MPHGKFTASTLLIVADVTRAILKILSYIMTSMLLHALDSGVFHNRNFYFTTFTCLLHMNDKLFLSIKEFDVGAPWERIVTYDLYFVFTCSTNYSQHLHGYSWRTCCRSWFQSCWMYILAWFSIRNSPFEEFARLPLKTSHNLHNVARACFILCHYLEVLLLPSIWVITPQGPAASHGLHLVAYTHLNWHHHRNSLRKYLYDHSFKGRRVSHDLLLFFVLAQTNFSFTTMYGKSLKMHCK